MKPNRKTATIAAALPNILSRSQVSILSQIRDHPAFGLLW
jgi:hypothetical protein